MLSELQIRTQPLVYASLNLDFQKNFGYAEFFTGES